MSEDPIKALNDEQLNIALKILIEKNPFLLIEKEFLKIRTKKGEIVTFKLNPCQSKVLAIVKDLWMKNKPIRIVILKARQHGISTLVQAIIFALSSQLHNKTSLVIGYDKDNANHLFDIGRRYYEELSKPNFEFSFLVGDKEKSNEKKIKFEDTQSEIHVDTANNLSSGRSFTYQYMHCSEIAFWSHADINYTGLNQSIPLLPNTMQFNESTANGIGNYFHQMWTEAVEDKDKPGSLIYPIFLGWHENPEYAMEIEDYENFKVGQDHWVEEFALKTTFNLTHEQLKWRRTIIETNWKAESIDRRKELFKQEYPATPNEAFLASGEPVFDSLILYRRYEEEDKAKNLYKKYYVIDYSDFYKFELGKENGLYGDIDIYQMPMKKFEYVAAIDVAEGVEGGDYSVMNIFNIRTGEQVLHYSCNIDVDLFGDKVNKILRLYNSPLCVIERNNHGHALITILSNQHKYGNLYVFKQDEKIGLPTTMVTRTIAINYLKELIRDEYFVIHSLKSIKELLTFINFKGKSQAQSNCHDDEVATLWLVAYVLREGLFDRVMSNAQHDPDNQNSQLKANYHDLISKMNKKGKGNKVTGY